MAAFAKAAVEGGIEHDAVQSLFQAGDQSHMAAAVRALICTLGLGPQNACYQVIATSANLCGCKRQSFI